MQSDLHDSKTSEGVNRIMREKGSVHVEAHPDLRYFEEEDFLKRFYQNERMDEG